MSQAGRFLLGVNGTIVETLTGNDGSPVASDLVGNIDIFGSTPVVVTGTPASNLLTITVDSSTTTAEGVAELATDAETIAGSDSVRIVVPSSLAAKLGTQTQFAVAYGDTTSNALGWTSAGANGQLVIAATGAAPEFASITSTGGSIAITEGVNSLNIEALGTLGLTFLTDDLNTALPAAGVITIAGGSNINTASGASTVTFNLDSTVSISGSMTAGTGFTATGGDVTISVGNINMPVTNAALTEGVIQVSGTRFIHSFGTNNTFAGATSGNGTLSSTGNSGFGFDVLNSLGNGQDNSCFGSGSGTAISQGARNTGIGFNSLTGIGTANFNTALGAFSGSNLTAANSNNILIGNKGVAGDVSTIRIGNQGAGSDLQNKCFIAGIIGVTPAVANADLVVMDSSGQLGTDGTGHAVAIHGWIGAIVETPAVTVTSDGATITFSVERSGGGNLTVVFSDGYFAWTTAPDTIALTAGSDTSPQINYIFMPQATKVLTVSTSAFPSAEHAPLATVLCQSAASLQTDGAYKVHAWTDHVSDSSNNGHIAHLNEWIRGQNATWQSGVTPTLTIIPQGGAADNVIFTSTAGVVLQLHDHTFPAFAGTPDIYVVNNFATNFVKVTDLNTQLTDSVNGSMSGKFFSLVIWGVVSEDTADCKLMCNLPGGSYNTQAGLLADSSKFADFSIPTDFKGTGFLIAELQLRHQNASSGTWTEIALNDLRGLFPSLAAGGATPGQTEFEDNTFRILDDGDNTKELAFQVSAITTATTRTITMDDRDIDMDAVPTSVGTDSGTATPAAGTFTVTGGSNINTSGATSVVTVNLDNTIDLAGNLKLPTTTAALTAGVIEINSVRWAHSFGTANTFVGSASGNGSLTSVACSGFGTNSLDALTSADNASAFGYLSLSSCTVGDSNSAFGRSSLQSLTEATNCTFAGYNSGISILTGIRNTGFGVLTLDGITTGQYNCAFGERSGANLTTSDSDNVLLCNIGVSGDNNKIRIGTQGTGDGQQDEAFIAGTVNCATGVVATTGDVVATAGNFNLPTTTAALTAGVVEINSVRFFHAFGTNNLFVGSNCGNGTLTGARNLAAGGAALFKLTSGSENVILGYLAGFDMESSDSCVAIGNEAMTNSVSSLNSVFIGHGSGKTITAGNRNTACGISSLGTIGTGSFNTALGDRAGNTLTLTDSDNLLLAHPGVAGDNHKLRIGSNGSGNGQQNKCFIAGTRGVTTDNADAIAVLIDSAGQLGTASSSIRAKENVQDMGSSTVSLLDLRPVRFDYIDKPSKRKQYGLIAEEVEQVMPDLVVYDAENLPETVRYHELPVMLLNEMKKLRDNEIKELRDRIDILEQKLKEI